jgi:subtilisin family serine protease
VVRFRPSADAEDRSRARARVGARVERAVPRRAGLQLVDLRAGQSVREAEAAFDRAPEVLYAEPNFRVVPDSVPNDPMLADQWDLARMDVPEAWDVTTGSRDVVVAVLDSGVEMRHPDIRENLWTNDGETGAGRETNGVDDDANGYVDDWRGWNFDGYGPPTENDPTDYSNHGTHAAGVIGAVGDNGVGISGIAQRVRIMPLVTWSAGSFGVAEAVTYAAREGVRIANGSFGIPYAQVIEDALAAAPKLLLSVSAGNQAWDVEQHKAGRYPCVSTLPNVICVAATDHGDNLAGFSNWGSESVDLGAPGVGIRALTLPQHNLLRDEFDAPLDGRWARGGAGSAWDRTTEDPDWPSSWSGWLHDSPSGPYAPSSDTWIGNATPFDLTGHSGCSLAYLVAHDLGAGDSLRVEVSHDGTAWTPLTANTGVDDWRFERHDLAAYAGRPGFRFRFRLVSDAAGQGRGVRIDYVQLWCRTPPFRGDEYASVDGTSFAAPHVAGTAALVLAHRPWLTRDQLRAAILENVEPLPALARRTVTGGRLNARWALTGPPPPEVATSAGPAGEDEPRATGGPSVLPDRRAPACSVRVRPARGAAVRLAVRCDEAGRLRARVVLRRGARPVMGSATATLRAPVARSLRVRLAPRWQRRLRSAGVLHAAVRVRATDAAGNARTVVRRVTLRR